MKTSDREIMAEAVELAALMGADSVDKALRAAAAAGRFGAGDLLSILGYQGAGSADAGMAVADDQHALQPGTSGWAGFTTTAGPA